MRSKTIRTPSIEQSMPPTRSGLRRSTAGSSADSSGADSFHSMQSTAEDDEEYLPGLERPTISSLSELGTRFTQLGNGKALAQIPLPSTVGEGVNGNSAMEGDSEGEDEVDNDSEDEAPVAGPLRLADGAERRREGTPKIYPPLPATRVYIETPEEIEAKAIAMGLHSPPKVKTGSSQSQSVNLLPIPPPSSVLQMPSIHHASSSPSGTAPFSSSSASRITMTDEQRQRAELNRINALAKKAERDALKRAEEDKVKQERFDKKREQGQLSLERFGIAFGSNRIPKKDFRVPLAQTPEARRKQEERKQEIVALREQIQERQRQQMESPPEPFQPDPQCSAEQVRILNEVRVGRNVFYTGSAGTGKSFVLNEIVRMLEADRRTVAVTAPTGIAAINVSGQTFHSFAKVGLGQGSVHELYNRVMAGQAKQQREAMRAGRPRPVSHPIVFNKVLIIDEISMLPPDLFERVSIVAKAMRNDPRPFGGLQVILSGDFFQLPSIQKDDGITCPYCGSPGFERNRRERTLRCIQPLGVKFPGEACGRTRNEYRYCFETPTWRELGLTVVQLAQVFRQDNAVFINALNKVRRGVVDDETDALFAARARPLGPHKIFPTNLYPKKNDVSTENMKQFDKLEDEATVFKCTDVIQGPYAHTFTNRLDKDIQAPKHLELKVGAQVLLLANLDVPAGLVNGSRGVVIDWHDSKDPNSHPEARNLAGPVMRRDDQAWRQAAEETWRAEQEHTALPVVLFASGQTVIINPHIWTVEIDRENHLARSQLPLALAWAMTCHKSQGQSLDRLIVNLQGTFEKGQAYVALSRARTLEGLQVVGWRREVVLTDSLVAAFYEALDEGKPFGDHTQPFPRVEDYFPREIIASVTHGEHWKPPARYFATQLSHNRPFPIPPRKASPSDSQSLSSIAQTHTSDRSLHGITAASLERLHNSRTEFSHGLATPESETTPGTVDSSLTEFYSRLARDLTNLAQTLRGRPGWDADSVARHAAQAVRSVLLPFEVPAAGPSNVKRERDDVHVKSEYDGVRHIKAEDGNSQPAASVSDGKRRRSRKKQKNRHQPT